MHAWLYTWLYKEFHNFAYLPFTLFMLILSDLLRPTSNTQKDVKSFQIRKSLQMPPMIKIFADVAPTNLKCVVSQITTLCCVTHNLYLIDSPDIYFN